MSNPTQPIPSAFGEFLAHFGAPPGTQDLKAECEKWQRLCGQLVEERERLRSDLKKAQTEKKIYDKLAAAQAVDYRIFDVTQEEMLSIVDRETTMEQLVAELERDAEPKV